MGRRRAHGCETLFLVSSPKRLIDPLGGVSALAKLIKLSMRPMLARWIQAFPQGLFLNAFDLGLGAVGGAGLRDTLRHGLADAREHAQKGGIVLKRGAVFKNEPKQCLAITAAIRAESLVCFFGSALELIAPLASQLRTRQPRRVGARGGLRITLGFDIGDLS